jgi:hypothetical protein
MLRSLLSRRFWIRIRRFPGDSGAKFSQGGKDVLIWQAVSLKVRKNQGGEIFIPQVIP